MSKGEPLRLAWFATGTGATSPLLLRAALGEIESGGLNARIVVVFSNREPGEDDASDRYRALVKATGIPLVSLSDRRFRRERGGEVARKGAALPQWRLDYDRDVMRLLKRYPFDIGVLAGYKLIFGPEAAARWDLLNLHPAAPGGPKGVWQDVIWELIKQRAERAGVMIHLVTADLDEGPAVTYCTYPIRGPEFDSLWAAIEGRKADEVGAEERENNALFQAIRRHGVARELPLVIETLRAFADGRIQIAGKRIVDAAGDDFGALNLTQRIEQMVAAGADA